MSIRKGRLSAAKIEQNFCDLHAPLNALQAEQEAARCLFCHDAPCVDACPTGIDVPGFIRKIASANLTGAAITILEENIMGATCANVCPVEELCEEVCVKNTSEHKPVVIGQLQRFATDHLLAQGQQPFQRAAASGKHIAVVGAGPAGLSCAHRLAMLGHRVSIFEARQKAGGLNEYGLAAYKMNQQRAAKEVEFILGIGGIEIIYAQTLGKDISLDQLRQQFDAVFIGLGHNDTNSLGLENEAVEGVFNAVDYIEDIRQQDLTSLPVGRDVVVIGGGNTAIDIAVQIKKLGAENVSMVYRRSLAEMGATEYEQHLAQTNGVVIRTHAKPVAIHAEGGKLSAVEFEHTQSDSSGGLSGSGECFSLAADQLFKAIGQCFNPRPLKGSECPQLVAGRIQVDEQQRTSLDNVWAGGDCTAGADLTVEAVNDGKLAALSIHKFLD